MKKARRERNCTGGYKRNRLGMHRVGSIVVCEVVYVEIKVVFFVFKRAAVETFAAVFGRQHIVFYFAAFFFGGSAGSAIAHGVSSYACHLEILQLLFRRDVSKHLRHLGCAHSLGYWH